VDVVARIQDRPRTRVLWGTVGVLAARNVSVPLLPAATYIPVNLALGAGLVVVARAVGTTWAQLGLAGRQLRSGVRWGVAVGAAAAAVMAIGAALPLTRPLFEDGRVQIDNGLGELAHQALVRIPLGTVLFEEVAFRGVLLALLMQRMSTRSAVLVNSALFGLWHIVPTLGAADTNDIGGLAQAGTVAGAVVVTFVGGVVFCALRLRSGHLVAPVLLHLAFNVTGYALSWAVQS
jgi:uncharacterized protein